MRELLIDEIVAVSGGTYDEDGNWFDDGSDDELVSFDAKSKGGGGGTSTSTGSSTPTGQCPPGTNNPTCPGTNSATDQVVQSAQQGNYGTSVGTAISNAPTIIGNGIDGLVNMAKTAVNPTTTDSSTGCVTNTTSGTVTCPISTPR